MQAVAAGSTVADEIADDDESDNAAQSGRRLEDEIEASLAALGFEIIPIGEWREARLYNEPDLRAAIRNAPYQSIYGHRARIEFLLILGERQILVETKRQRVSGSVDEKFPYVYLNARENLPAREFIFVLDGDGWKPQARAWISARAGETDGFYVFDPDGFAAWIATEIAVN